KNSPTVGMSGSASERVAVVTASARSLPALMYSITEGMEVNVTCTCPPSKSVSEGAVRSQAAPTHGFRSYVEIPNDWHPWLLRASHHRPQGRRAAEQRG